MSFLQLISADGDIFDVSNNELKCSRLLTKVACDLIVVTKIPFNNISTDNMIFIHKFMKLAANPPGDNWVQNYIADCSADLCSLLHSAHFLEMDLLTDAITDYIAKKIEKCQTINELRTRLHITNDLTPDEEAGVRLQVDWALSPEDKM